MSEGPLTILEVLNLALTAFQAGAIAQAEGLCRTVVRDAPHSFDAAHLLAVIQSSSGQGEKALESYERALALRPLSPEAWNNRGSMLHDLARFEEAIASFDRALTIRPDYAEALYNSGNSLRRLGRFAEALERYAQVLALRPDDTEALNNQGTALHALGRYEAALASYDQALALRPDYVEALYNRASTLHRLRQLAPALAGFDAALALRPDLTEAHINRGNVLRDLKRFEDALASYERALAVAPDNLEALNNRGHALADLKRHEEAIESFDKVLAKRPDFAEAWNNRGNSMKDLGRFEEAFACYDRAVAVRPNFAEALCNRGLALKELGRLPEALASYDQALAVQPGFAKCEWNRAVAVLLSGPFEVGWHGYEWRRKKESWVGRTLPGPEWTGGDPSGKRLYFYAEQGLGDAIQFSRFARRVAAAGAEVFLEVRPCLVGLMRSLAGVKVIRQGDAPPPFDAHLPLMSLPRLLAPGTSDLGTDVAYLSAEPQRIKAWAGRLPAGRFRIGIVWQGNPFGDVDKGRSIPLRAFAPLSRISGVTLVSLQKNDGVDQLADAADMAVATLPDDFDAGGDAFLDAAAAIMTLDLVICCDTAIVHLAGALGRPVWLALKHVPDWRWMLDRADSPWYPTARLFRQKRRNDWDELFERIAEEVAQLTRPRAIAAA